MFTVNSINIYKPMFSLTGQKAEIEIKCKSLQMAILL